MKTRRSDLVDVVFVCKRESTELYELPADESITRDLRLRGMLSAALFGETDDATATGRSNGSIDAKLAALSGDFGLRSSDIEEIADLIPRDSCVAFLLLEHEWTKEFRDSIVRSNGHILAHGWVNETTFPDSPVGHPAIDL